MNPALFNNKLLMFLKFAKNIFDFLLLFFWKDIAF